MGTTVGLFKNDSNVGGVNIPVMVHDSRILRERQRLVDVQLQLLDAEKKLNDLQHQKADYKSTLNKQADAIIAGKRLSAADVAELERGYQFMHKEIKVLRVAIERQQVNLRNVETEVSQEICVNMKPHYRKIALDVLAHAISLHEALVAERIFWKALEDQGVSMGYMARCPATVSGFKGEGKFDQNGKLYWFLRSLLDNGVITKADVPGKYWDGFLFKFVSDYSK